MNAQQMLSLNRMLDDIEGKLPNAKLAAIGKCSTDMALRNISELLEARGFANAGGGAQP